MEGEEHTAYNKFIEEKMDEKSKNTFKNFEIENSKKTQKMVN